MSAVDLICPPYESSLVKVSGLLAQQAAMLPKAMTRLRSLPVDPVYMANALKVMRSP